MIWCANPRYSTIIHDIPSYSIPFQDSPWCDYMMRYSTIIHDWWWWLIHPHLNAEFKAWGAAKRHIHVLHIPHSPRIGIDRLILVPPHSPIPHYSNTTHRIGKCAFTEFSRSALKVSKWDGGPKCTKPTPHRQPSRPFWVSERGGIRSVRIWRLW